MTNQQLVAFISAVEKLAFEMPAPNPYTPRLVQMCQEATRLAAQREYVQREEVNRLYRYLEECQDMMLEVLSAGNGPEGMADLQRKITNALSSRPRQ